MYRLVMWSLALAMIPLSIAGIWEVVIVTRGFFARSARKDSDSIARARKSRLFARR